MELLWLPFSIATILLCGLGQVFVKETRTSVSSANYLVLLGVHILVIGGAYWLFFRESSSHDSWVWAQAVIGAALSGVAYVTYYEAVRHGKISIVGTVAGAYGPWTVFLALVFLGESMTAGEGIGVTLVIGAMLLFTFMAGNGRETKRTELLGIVFAMASFFFWGTSAVVSKGAINEMGEANFVGVFALVCPAIWFAYWMGTEKGKFEMPKTRMRILELSMLFLAGGMVTLYMAFANGNVSIVSPVTNLYPIVTIVVAKSRLKEQLTLRQYVAVAMLLIAVPMFSL